MEKRFVLSVVRLVLVLAVFVAQVYFLATILSLSKEHDVVEKKVIEQVDDECSAQASFVIKWKTYLELEPGLERLYEVKVEILPLLTLDEGKKEVLSNLVKTELKDLTAKELVSSRADLHKKIQEKLVNECHMDLPFQIIDMEFIPS